MMEANLVLLPRLELGIEPNVLMADTCYECGTTENNSNLATELETISALRHFCCIFILGVGTPS